VVILQLTVSANGIVTDARVLRSIPLLDAAAIEAAKLWQYEPRPGAPPLTLTAAVPFTP
jgi:TonB family protein